ncbi:hypothetical protein EDB19DRAFT_1828867 [Suillus lakei]|nr:hypothetical protein EDB19DRAFT_1828867 [Suillus lakei]
MILGQFSASVFIDNEPLPEYKKVESRTAQEHKITCWIPSQAGKTFDVRGEVLKAQYPGIKSFVTVDGMSCPSWVVLPPWTGTLEHDCISNETEKEELMFKKIEFTDDDAVLNNDTSHIGQIIMKLRRGTFTKAKSVRRKTKSTGGHTLHVLDGRVHERSKKGRCHQVGLGKTARDREKQTAYTDDYDDSHPMTVFVFNYTSLDNLQAMGVVPSESSLEVTHIRESELKLKYLHADLKPVTSSSSSEDQKPLHVKLEHHDGGLRCVIDLTKD